MEDVWEIIMTTDRKPMRLRDWKEFIFENLPNSPRVTERTVDVARGYGRGGVRGAHLAGEEYDFRKGRGILGRLYDFYNRIV